MTEVIAGAIRVVEDAPVHLTKERQRGPVGARRNRWTGGLGGIRGRLLQRRKLGAQRLKSGALPLQFRRLRRGQLLQRAKSIAFVLCRSRPEYRQRQRQCGRDTHPGTHGAGEASIAYTKMERTGAILAPFSDYHWP